MVNNYYDKLLFLLGFKNIDNIQLLKTKNIRPRLYSELVRKKIVLQIARKTKTHKNRPFLVHF